MNLTTKRNSNLEQLIINGDYYEAMKYVSVFDEDDIFSFLYNFAEDEKHLAAYTFSCFMYEQTLSEEWHEFIWLLTMTSFVSIDGMNYIRVFYSREMAKNNRTVENLSGLLEMNFCPDTEELINKSESILLAEEILGIDKSERVANKFMEELKLGNIKENMQDENFVTCLEMGLYEKALDYLECMDGISKHEFCVEYAKKEQSLEIFCFVQYMIKKTKAAEWVRIVIDVLTNGLQSLEEYGVCDVALFFEKQLA